VDLLYSNLYNRLYKLQQIELMEFEPIQLTIIADTSRGAVYIAQWLTECEGHRRMGAIGMS